MQYLFAQSATIPRHGRGFLVLDEFSFELKPQQALLAIALDEIAHFGNLRRG